MKKALLLAMLGLAGFTAQAQLPNGSTAPDFTVTDINGNTHTLSQYLSEGKTVILDISASWCGPCWGFHNSHALADLHDSFGPGGSNEVVVLFVEGDPGTSVESLYGTNTASDVSTTQGNWTLGSPYPIIDSGTVADLYQINYFPTLYRICPDGIVTEIDPALAPNLVSNINGGCGQLTGAQNHAKAIAENVRVCEANGNVAAKIKNYGVNPITAATVVLKENSTVVATQEYSGNINAFATGTVQFTNVQFNPQAAYTAEITAINANTPLSAELASSEFIVEMAPEANNFIIVHCFTDNYPNEISWNIKDSSGAVVFVSPEYLAGPGAAGAGGPDANTTKTHYVTLPEGTDCYSFEMHDAYGDGWSLGSTYHGLQIVDLTNGAVTHYEAGNFGTLKAIPSAFKSNGALANETFEAAKFAIYPNPSTGVFNFVTEETVTVTVTDMTGKTVFTAATVENGSAIDLSALQSGMYIAKVTGATTERIEKLVIK